MSERLTIDDLLRSARIVLNGVNPNLIITLERRRPAKVWTILTAWKRENGLYTPVMTTELDTVDLLTEQLLDEAHTLVNQAIPVAYP